MRRATRIYAWSTGATVLVIAALWALTWLGIESAYQDDAELAQQQAHNAAEKLAERTARLLDRIDQTATLVKYLAHRDGGVDLQRLKEDGLLVDRSAAPAVHLVDAFGRVVQGTMLAKNTDVSNRSYFTSAQRDATDQLHVFAPVQGRLAGKWIVPASKRLERSDGSFAGAVVVSLDASYLTKGFKVSGHPDTLIGIVGADGTYRSRTTAKETVIGERIDPQRVSSAAAGKPQLLAPTSSPLDGVLRFDALVPVGKYDLYAIVAIPEATAMAEFRSVRGYFIAGAALAALIVLGVSAFLTRQAVRLSRTRQEKRAAEERLSNEKEFLQVTLRAIGDGVLTTDVDGRITYLNPAAEEITGWPSLAALGRQVGDVICIQDRHTGQVGHNPVMTR